MENWFDIPHLAIKAFENATKLTVSVHESTGALWGFLPPDRFVHGNPACVAAKNLRLDACVRFDVLQTEMALAQQPHGRVHICHAGLVEWVVPTFAQGQIQRVLFAGQRRPGPKLHCDKSDQVHIHRTWAAHLQALQPVEDDEAQWLLESLRQLSARLELWRMHPPESVLEHAPQETSKRGNLKLLSQHLVPRQQQIHHFIQSHHTKPLTLADMARYLHLSEHRAGHAIRQACGHSFVELLIRARLRTAAGLLRHTDMSVSEVAQASGFRNLSHFHSVFRTRMQTTPHRYRSQTEMNAKAES